jgi:hypothetical protein
MCVKVQNWQGTMVIEEGYLFFFLGVCVQLIVGESKDWVTHGFQNSKH